MSKRLVKGPRVRTAGGLAVLITAFIAILAFTAGGAAAATHGAQAASSDTATFTGKHVTITRIASGKTLPQGVQPDLAFLACSGLTDIPAAGGCSTTPKDTGAPGTGVGAPNLPSGLSVPSSPTLVAGFPGISDVGQRTVTGYHTTPPDQALCVGPASALGPLGLSGSDSVIVEGVNSAIQIYATDGTSLMGPISLTQLFDDPYASGDIGCNYDPSTGTFFFTEIGAYAGLFYDTGLVVINADGYSAYQLDTANRGRCFPDFPQQGFDNNAFYITVNEFCGPNENLYPGASVYALSKSQLVSATSGTGSVNGVSFGPVKLNGNPVVTLRPAIGNGTDTEYLLNSISYDRSGNNQASANTLGFWQVKGDSNITSGHGSVTLKGKPISSETYAFPVPAQSTGDGTTCVATLYTSSGTPWCTIPERTLEPDDSRLEQVQYANGQLYTALNTAMTIGNVGTVVDGAAWFQVDAEKAMVAKQGYVGVAGTYLLYPSFVRTDSGTFVMDFSMTSPTLDPSTGYTTSDDTGSSFAAVTTTGVGSGPHVSFSTLEPGYMRARWGDYSAMAFDPANGDVWMADEYIPPAPDGSDVVDNWGTYVWGLSG